MYKFLGLAMMGVFAMMVIPSGISADQDGSLFYGMATMVKNDSLGNEVFQQSVHNDLTDEGEAYILESVFSDGVTAPADNVSMGAICISAASATEGDGSIEDDTAATFDSTNTLNDGADLTCEDDQGNVGISSSVATIGPLTFAAGGDNMDDGDTINSLGICQKDTDNTGDAGFVDCQLGSAGTGELLSVVSVTATTLNTGETVDITYTFDLSSGTS